MAVVPFQEWRPDMPDLGQWAREALNVVPAEESYHPFPSLDVATSALTARAQGAAWFRCPDGTQKTFAGDASKLYLLEASQTFNDVSQVSTTYNTSNDAFWRFEQFGSIAIATNGTDNIQKFDLGSVTGNWMDLPGSPPTAKWIAVVKDFVVLGNLASHPQKIQWCAINDPTNWASSTGGKDITVEADIQELPDGGQINGMIGGEFGLVFQESAIRRMTYESVPLIFRIDKIAKDLGCTVPTSLAGVADVAVFLHQSGFYMVQGGQTITPIGRGKVDNTFWAEFDQANHFRSSATFDPARGLYVFVYPAKGGDGSPNRCLIYNVRTSKWSRAVFDCEMVFSGISQDSYTLEQLNDVSSTLEGLPFSLDSSFWVGASALLLFGFDTDHKAGAFSGSNLAATVETSELNLGQGRRVAIQSCRPLIDGGTPTISVGCREAQQGSVAYTNPQAVNSYGLAPLRRSTRYARFRAVIPAAATWQNAQGVDDIKFTLQGGR